MLRPFLGYNPAVVNATVDVAVIEDCIILVVAMGRFPTRNSGRFESTGKRCALSAEVACRRALDPPRLAGLDEGAAVPVGGNG